MYAKTLVPGPPIDVPGITATTSEADVVMPQLLNRGWGIFGGPPPMNASGRVAITHHRLRVIVDDEAILDDDLNPASPPGWWKAVDAIGGRVTVVIVRAGDVDLECPSAGTQLRALLDTGRAVWAVLPVAEE